MDFLNRNKGILLSISSTILYFFFAYFLERTQFNTLVITWFFLFVCFYLLMKTEQLSFKYLAGIAIIFRLIFLFATPNLSQDFYRFIWDGRMLLEGFNPYLYLPETFIQQRSFPIPEAQELYNGMGELNGSHYTNYPPLNQLSFFIAALFAGKSIFWSAVVLRLQIIIADIGILYFGSKLLKNLNLNPKKIFWYILNPFVIIELTGNLHFEPVMLFFLIWSLYKLQQQKWIFAGILLACSVTVKLIPLLFLPLFFQWFTSTSLSNLKKSTQKLKWIPSFAGMTKLFGFYAIVIITSLLLFLPFYSLELIENYMNSVGLWFKNFEFNASIYYVFREIGYLFRGYNEIAFIGKALPILTILFLVYLSLFRRNNSFKDLITTLLFGLSFYYFTTTTMHPWYLATLILLSLFTKYKFPIVWSLVVILSYQAYANIPWKENLWFVAIEYSIVYGFLIWELKGFKPKIY
ncbi:mannosyltransferase [Tenacibaculum todarodis]|uniref:Mannosyltransferase n=1 Tax=Tenacibaculum todarodis TaxID=1850252 RepID=A0A1L3JJQ6_9FLAO|nr:mannosyltransferase [Tenacibaculum todarodis]APG65344.1 mannosyltransferase [Tenacibaculum todarodis]